MNRYEASFGTLRGAVSIGGIMSSLELFSLVAGLVGGLAMFLYGMNVMSGGLTKAAGGKLESVLAKVTEHPIIAYAFGVAVTAIVQSSSASTVMVVGLVNSGIMTLKQAVNVILGANLGTTITAWILSLASLNGTASLVFKFFQPAKLMAWAAAFDIVLCLIVILMSGSGMIAVIALVLISFFMSLQFPTIYGIALEGVGEDAKIGASGLIMAILGGAILTPLQGMVSDKFGISVSYVVPLICFVVVLWYSIYSQRKGQYSMVNVQ